MGRSRGKTARIRGEADSAHIHGLAHNGQGIANVAGKAVFIEGALPGEDVRFKYTGWRGQYAEGQVETILHASPERTEPGCRHYGVCGGCCLQHLQHEKQILYKEQWLLDNLTRLAKVEPQEILKPLVGKPWGYRYKARLGVKYVIKKERVLVGFRERHSSYVADLQSCDVLHPRVGGKLMELSDLVGSLSIYNGVPQIEVAAGDDQVALCFRVLKTPNDTDKNLLIDFGRRHGFHIYLQPKGPRTTYSLWPAVSSPLYYRLADQGLNLSFQPYHFTQINPEINCQIVNRALALMTPNPGERILDLFCGLGNFTLPMARCAREVVGVDGDSQLVDWGRYNAQCNGIHNARFYAADLTRSLENQPWVNGRYDKVLLDPPRSGALEIIPQVALLQPRQIVYISCHPATLARDAGELVHRFGYRLLKAGVMDMFPHTAHVESMALFVST